MKISICIKSLVLGLMAISSISYAHTDTTTTKTTPRIPSKLLGNKNQDQLERILTGALSILQKIDLILEDLAQIVNNNIIQTPNKRAVKDSIRDLRKIIDTLRSEATVNVDAQTIHVLMRFNDALMQHIATALNNGLVQLPPFNMGSLKLRTTKLITLEHLQEDLLTNDANAKQLEVASHNAGLKWYNKVYRGIDNLVQKGNKYYLWHMAALGGITGAAALYIMYRYDKCKDVPFFGPCPSYEPSGDLKKHLNLKTVGAIDNFFHQNQLGRMPIWASFLAPAAFGAWGAALMKVKDKTINAASHFSNFLKGGAYLNKKVNDVERMQPRVTFDDLVGLNYVKDTFRPVLKYLENPEVFERTQLAPEKGYLFTGATRTGKSYTAEAFFGEIRKMLKENNRDEDEISFFVINSSLIIERGIQWILMLAKRTAPCVLFIDEIDLLGLERITGNKQLLSEFLSSMSGCMETDPKKQVIILAATNKPENIDHALLQKGRFGKSINFEYPTFSDRKAYVVNKLNSLAINTSNFNIDKLAYETENCSYEDLNSMIKYALSKAKIRGETLTQAHLETALDEEIRNIIFNYDKTLSHDESAIIAAHQAGHALSHMLLDTHYKIARATIMPVNVKIVEQPIWVRTDDKDKKHGQKPIEYGQVFTYHEHDTIKFETRADKMNQLKTHLAGHIAEEIIVGSCGYTYHNEDKQHAFEIAKALVFGGINIDQLPKSVKAKMLDDAYALVTKAEQEMRQLLIQNCDKLKAISDALLKEKTLTAEQLYAAANLPMPATASDKTSATSEQVRSELGIDEELPSK